jgi:hypothetical protein
VQLFRRFRNVPIVSISAAQGARVPAANWIATVHHRLLADLHAFRADAGQLPCIPQPDLTREAHGE